VFNEFDRDDYAPQQDLYRLHTITSNALPGGVVAKPGIATGSRSKELRLVIRKDTRGSRVQMV
jgi:hypothetical protein